MSVRSDSVSPTVAWAAGPTRPTQYTSHTANNDSISISATIGEQHDRAAQGRGRVIVVAPAQGVANSGPPAGRRLPQTWGRRAFRHVAHRDHLVGKCASERATRQCP